MCRALDEGGRRCEHSHRARDADPYSRSREYHRKNRKPGDPDPFEELDDAVARFRAMREIAEEVLAKHHSEMVSAGLIETDADRLTEARRNAMLDGLLAVMASTEHRWVANTFTKGRSAPNQRARAAANEQTRSEAAYESHIAAARIESEIIASHSHPDESRDDTVHRLRLSTQRALPFLTPTRLVDWNTLGHLGHERAA